MQGRRLIYDTMAGANADFAWMEVNAQHAFIRDELSKGRCVDESHFAHTVVAAQVHTLQLNKDPALRNIVSLSPP